MRRAADLMLLATALIWGLNFPITKYVLDEGFQPIAYSAIRYTAGALLFAAVTYRWEGTLRVERRHVPLLLFAAALGIWLNQLSFTYALTYSTAATVALVFGTTPIFTLVFAALFRVERLTVRFVVASLVSFAGVALVAAGAGGFRANVWGILLALAGAATWAGYSVMIASLMRSYSPFRISAFVLIVGSIALSISGSGQLIDQDYSLGPLVWAALVFALLGPLVLTNLMWFTAIDRVGPSRSALFANLVPFLGAVFAFLLLSEKITALQIVGGVAIAAGIVLAVRSPVATPVGN